MQIVELRERDAGFSVLCEALANGDEAMAKGRSLDYVDCT
jgi:hypothetical protein